MELTGAECEAIDGAFTGNGTTCADNDANGVADICEAFIPPAPTVEDTLCDGGLVVTVSGLVPESSTVTVYEGGANIIGTAAIGSNSTAAVVVKPALAAGQSITAKQTAGGIDSALSEAVVVSTCTPPDATVVINELTYDNLGTDTLDFVELYNAGAAAVDIGGWVVRCSDEVAPPADNNADYGIPAGTILAAGDYYVIGGPTVPNLDQPVGTGELFEDGNELYELIDNTGGLHDTVATEQNKKLIASPAEGGFYGNFQLVADTPVTLARHLDGYDTNVNGRDFGGRPWSPGASNLTGSIVTAYTVADVDALTVGSLTPGLNGSYQDAQVIDPAVGALNTPNPNVIPASPQGGLCSVAWDTTGGGNATTSTDLLVGSFFDVYVYIDTAFYTVGGAESRAYSFMGSVDTVYNFPDPSGLLFGGGGIYNGTTGIGWLYEKEDSASLNTLWLFDAGPGGNSNPSTDWSYYASIDMSAVPSGWHRLSMNYDGATGAVVAKCDDQVFTFTTAPNLVGAFNIGYRETLQSQRYRLRPPTFDNVTIGDADVDGDVDLDDYNVIGNCLNGPNVNTPPAGCTAAQFDAADIDRDNDVDLEDWSHFQDAF